jgi:hypothetical protein
LRSVAESGSKLWKRKLNHMCFQKIENQYFIQFFE